MEEKKHTVTIRERRETVLTGIEAVVAFREDLAEFDSALGSLQITGADLHMEKLDLESGEVVLAGSVISLYYPDTAGEKRAGWLRRLFS